VGEEELKDAIDVLVRLVEAAGAIVIFVGCALGFFRFVGAAVRHRGRARFTAIRLDVGRYLALGLEFQLGADILRTAVAPTFEEIGQLAAVAAIRTALNYFLGREIKEQQDEVDREASSTS
jgi:uncharacterized membrane protein